MLSFTQRRNVKNPLWFATRSISVSITYDKNIERFFKALLLHFKNNCLKLQVIVKYNNSNLSRTKITSSNYSCCVFSWDLIGLISFKWISTNSTFSAKILVLGLKLKIEFIKSYLTRTTFQFLF